MEEMNLDLRISSSPHVKSKDTTSDIMFDVIIALVPATAFGICQFGLHAGLLVLACILTAIASEFLYQHFMKKNITIMDFSAAVTGLLIALNLPPSLPLWMGVIGSIFAIVIVKQLFGGLGQNFMNPALAARCFLLISFTARMTTFTYDGVTTATPLAILKAGGNVNVKDMFFGYTGGTIGETSAIALLIGAAYLLFKRVISPKIPVIYIGTFAICIATYAAIKDIEITHFLLAHLCGGGLMLGAWFMATDYVTSPITSVGKIIYAVMLGLITFVLRIFGGSAEGVSYAIVISNLFVPLIERYTRPRYFGYGAELKKVEEKVSSSKSSDKQTKDITKKQETDVAMSDENIARNIVDSSKSKESMDKKSIYKAVASITIISLIMGLVLGAVYDITKDSIDKANEKAKQKAYEEVYKNAGSVVVNKTLNNEAIEQGLSDAGFKSDDAGEINDVYDDAGEHIGYIIVVTNSEGYGGDIEICVGISDDGTVQGIAFLAIDETVGLGMEAQNASFREQFTNKNVQKYEYTKTGASSDSQIDALSGATITTSAVVDGVNAALEIKRIIEGGVAVE